MADTFGARARRFMGWHRPDDVDIEQDFFDIEEDLAEVTPLTPIRSEADTPRIQDTPTKDRMRIVTFHPTSYSDALPVGEAFRDGSPVILNLSDMSDEDARRIVDFAAGLTFGLQGVIKRVTSGVFLLSPKSVEVSGEGNASRHGSLFN
ncbi:cell division protein SepF [Schaalia suimastitidis]|uniref:cell division protein SepF n=1 Tax=Schaalia suimastitidis TaxID=121163 RepID=UPI00041B7DCF|nr:cell division protein SepF [Schaalia suimastitidis]